MKEGAGRSRGTEGGGGCRVGGGGLGGPRVRARGRWGGVGGSAEDVLGEEGGKRGDGEEGGLPGWPHRRNWAGGWVW